MQKVKFDIDQLNQKDRKIYDAMSDYERSLFESTWEQIETAKQRLIQQKNHSKLRNQREAKQLATRERKERTHRLIERGALLESLIDHPTAFTNEEIGEILIAALSEDKIINLIEEIRNRYNAPYIDNQEQKEEEETQNGEYF